MTPPEGRLPRTLGLWSSVALVIGITIGSGIFRSPAGIARQAPNPLVMIGLWVAGGAITLCGALSLAEIAAALPETGGIYAYLREAWGRRAAFLFGWSELVLIRASALGGIAVVFGEYLLRSVGVDPPRRFARRQRSPFHRALRWTPGRRQHRPGARQRALGLRRLGGSVVCLGGSEGARTQSASSHHSGHTCADWHLRDDQPRLSLRPADRGGRSIAAGGGGHHDGGLRPDGRCPRLRLRHDLVVQLAQRQHAGL